jgi:hypothetical protein
MHIWGDDFDRDGFYEAEKYFRKIYHMITGKHPIVKEKYGTLRFEMIDIWVTSEVEEKHWAQCILYTINKYPQFAKELTEDLISEFDTYWEMDHGKNN